MENIGREVDKDREEKILKWEKYAYSCCRRFLKCHISKQDLKQEALLYLIKAIDSYVPEKGNFNRYIGIAINNGLVDMCCHQMRYFRTPAHINKLLLKIRKLEKSEQLPNEQLALLLKVNIVTIKLARTCDSIIVTYLKDKEDYRENDKNRFIEAENEIAVELEKLSISQQTFLCRFYGICGFSKEKAKIIAQEIGVTPQLISKKAKKIVNKLKMHKTRKYKEVS